jgi:hypothetical protein
MPVLPIDATEPFAATLGVMLYPGADESAKARAFAALFLTKPLRDFHSAGYELRYEELAGIFDVEMEFLQTCQRGIGTHSRSGMLSRRTLAFLIFVPTSHPGTMRYRSSRAPFGMARGLGRLFRMRSAGSGPLPTYGGPGACAKAASATIWVWGTQAETIFNRSWPSRRSCSIGERTGDGRPRAVHL